jgi:hypothetical protein
MIYICNIPFTYDLHMQHIVYMHYICSMQPTYDLHMQHTIYTWILSTPIKIFVCSQFIENVSSRIWTSRWGWLPVSLATEFVLSHPLHTLTSTCPLELWPDLNCLSSEVIYPTPLESHVSLCGNVAPLPKITGGMSIIAYPKSKICPKFFVYVWRVTYAKYAQYVVYVCYVTHVAWAKLLLKYNIFVPHVPYVIHF